MDSHRELGLPPVFTTIPTRDKVVFLTIDDGAEKDPAFLRMMSDLDVPYTAFLSGYLVKDDDRYFRQMQARGAVLNNHTLWHRYMPGLSYRAQRREICGMQRFIERRYGTRPTLFRPPFGSYDRATLRAAKACGIEYAPSGTPRSSPTTGSTASRTGGCARGTSSSPTSGAANSGRARCPT